MFKMGFKDQAGDMAWEESVSGKWDLGQAKPEVT